MACGVCGLLFRRRDWNARASSADRTRRASRGTGLPHTAKAIAFQQDEEEDEKNQTFFREVWYSHMENTHHYDYSRWSRGVIATAFLSQEELKPYYEFATVEAPQHWNNILQQRVEDDEHWTTIHERLEFYALSGQEEDAKTTIELCLGLAKINWTPFHSASSQHAIAKGGLTPHENMTNSESAMEGNTNHSHFLLAQQQAPSLRVPYEEMIDSFPLPPPTSRHIALSLVPVELPNDLQSAASCYNPDEVNEMNVDEDLNMDEMFSDGLHS
ncbi:MAG: hypothetical protein Q9165_001663 [Trypethelium subeluteriae]